MDFKAHLIVLIDGILILIFIGKYSITVKLLIQLLVSLNDHFNLIRFLVPSILHSTFTNYTQLSYFYLLIHEIIQSI